MRSWIVHGLLGMNRVPEAAEVIRECIAHCRNSGERWMEPECVRLEGEIARRAGGPKDGAAEALFREATAIAQGARRQVLGTARCNVTGPIA